MGRTCKEGPERTALRTAFPVLLPRPHGAHELLHAGNARQNPGDEVLAPVSLTLPRLWLQASSAHGPSWAEATSPGEPWPREETETPPGRGAGPDPWPSASPPGVACSAILMYTFCTDCWLIAVLYFTWLAFDWNTPKKGRSATSLPHPLALGTLPPTGTEVPQCGGRPFLLSTCYVKSGQLGQGAVLGPGCRKPLGGPHPGPQRSSHSTKGLPNLREQRWERAQWEEGEDAWQGDHPLTQGLTLGLSSLPFAHMSPAPTPAPSYPVFCSLEGGRRSQWVRNWAVWRYFRDYFPIQVKTCGC